MTRPLWIFGYGSLVWRPAFEYVERREGFVRGWTRRFWQHSTDHRGVPGAPGRVVTLVRHAEAECWGAAYRVTKAAAGRVLARLDHREKNGYARHTVTFFGAGPEAPTAEALVYIATPDNPAFAGHAPLSAIAAQVRRSVGPSGDNRSYVLSLAEALRQMGAQDEHVFGLADLLGADAPQP